MNRTHGYRSGFDFDDYDSKGTPYHGPIGPRRSLYTDERYNDRDLYLREEEERRVWDLEEMGIHHDETLDLVGDERNMGFSGLGPKDYKRSDEKIFEDACEALFRSRYVDASGMEVSVKNGEVILTGEVVSREMKKHAERVIENIRGVVDVRNELKLAK